MLYRLKKYFRLCRQKLFEALGNPKYTPKPSKNNLDDKLGKYLNFRKGFFIEAGANDGIRQSNTYYLENGLRWKGILVEAIPDLYEKCRSNRKRSKVVSGALVSPSYAKDTMTMHYVDLMSIAENARPTEDFNKHIDWRSRLPNQNLSSLHLPC